MLALINPDEKIYDKDGNVLGSRVCYFYNDAFDVSEPLFFVDVSEIYSEKDSQFYYYDDVTFNVEEIPQEKLPEALAPTIQAEPPALPESIVEKLLIKKLKEYGIVLPTANTL
jgi:hypothetical protein